KPLHLQALGDQTVLLDVDLRDDKASFEVTGELLEQGSDCATGSAPCRIEVHDDGHLRVRDQRIEVCIRDVDGFGLLAVAHRFVTFLFAGTALSFENPEALTLFSIASLLWEEEWIKSSAATYV